MARYSVYHTNFETLASLGDLGSVLVRLMMAVNDFVVADEGMGRWQAELSPKLRERSVPAARYFLRLMMAHIHEALEIIREINDNPNLAKSVGACDAKTQSSYAKLKDFLDGDDHKLIIRIRNNLAFHHPAKVASKSVERLARQFPKKVLSFTMGAETINWHFVPAEWVENEIVVREIFKVPDQGDVDLQRATAEIVVRLHAVASVLSDFAGYFIRHHAKAR